MVALEDVPDWLRERVAPDLAAQSKNQKYLRANITEYSKSAYRRALKKGQCRGRLHAVYVRQGTPPRWIRVGTLCLKCRAFISTSPPKD